MASISSRRLAASTISSSKSSSGQSDRAGTPKQVILVAHSMGGLIARCMIQKICRMKCGRPPN